MNCFFPRQFQEPALVCPLKSIRLYVTARQEPSTFEPLTRWRPVSDQMANGLRPDRPPAIAITLIIARDSPNNHGHSLNSLLAVFTCESAGTTVFCNGLPHLIPFVSCPSLWIGFPSYQHPEHVCNWMIAGEVVMTECVAIRCGNYVDILWYKSALAYEFMTDNQFKNAIMVFYLFI